MDDAIVRLARKGDTDAFEKLVRLYEKPVYNMALRFSGNPQDALDLSQEVFIRVYRSLPKFRGDSAFSTWLYRLVSNICIDHARKQARRMETPLVTQFDDADEQILDIPDARYSPETEFEKQQLRESLNAALEQLSPEHRMIVLLREIGGLSYEEIAGTQGLEAGTVKSRLNRARASLKKALLRDGNIFETAPSNATKTGKGGE